MAIIGDLEEDLINVDPRKHNFSISSSKWTRSSSSSLSPFATSETVTSTAPLVDCAIHPPVPARVDEKDLGLLQGIRLYPKAVTWSVLISLTLVMEGYSTILVPNLFALGPFRKQFGDLQPNEQWEIGAAWQSALVNGGLVGQILGLFAAGVLAEKIGYRQTLMVGLWAMTAFIFVAFFATTKITLLVGQCLMGAPWGLFQCISTVYAADVCPVGLRAYLTTYVNACWVLGQLLASVVLRGTMASTTQWSYRIPFALQWVFPLPILLAVYFAPESPWWLVRQSRAEEAKANLRRLRNKPKDTNEEDHEKTLDRGLTEMYETNQREKEQESGISYLDCFKGTNRRRTEIACMSWVIQTLCGSTFMGFSTYFYEQAGLGSSHAFTLSLAQFSLGLLGVIVSWILMAHFGRRTLYLSGQALTLCFVLLIGVLACVPHSSTNHTATPPPSTFTTPTGNFTSPSDARFRRSVAAPSTPGMLVSTPSAINWSIAALLLLFTLTYDATIGPLCYSLVSEIPSTRLKSKTIVLARNCYNISGIVTNIVTPRMLNPTAWGWGARSGFFWTGTAVVGIVWSWWRLPEPKGRSYGELDELFARRTPARKFKGAVVGEAMGTVVDEKDGSVV